MTTALVLAGHGSHLSPQTADVVWRCVDQLRALGAAEEITAAFWKETPSLATVFNSLTADDITVVPLFTAQGFFTREVIPAEMRLAGAITQRGGRVIRYARTLSEHPYLGEVVRRRVAAALRDYALAPERTAVTVIGHGTRRTPESRAAAQAQAEALQAAGMVAEVVATYLDDSPSIDEVYALTRQPNIIAVPFFLALGSHTTTDVPRALGLPAGQTHGVLHGRQVCYTDPVGTGESLVEAVLALAREAGAPLPDLRAGSAWDCFPAAGRDALARAVLDAGALPFGQLSLTPAEVSITGDTGEKVTINDPAALRAFARENPFRPLATSRDLPDGWRVPVDSAAKLHAVVETVYPGATADWSAHQTGHFEAVAFDQTIARQVGMFQALADFAAVGDVVAQVCGCCVRHPTWFAGVSPAGAVPCAEACNVWLSAAKDWESR